MVVTWLRQFNAFWDDFILEFIKPVAILSMGLGTVAIFNLQGLAINPVFVASWAIVQAASIDGLFFATWDRLFSQKLKWANGLSIIGLLFIGLILVLVAIAINAIIGFQVLWGLADSQVAMARLGISPELFTYMRAVLAVVVFVMMSFVRARGTTESSKAVVGVVEQTASRYISATTRVEVSEQKGRKCVWCGYDGPDIQLDHIIPHSMGGSNTADNLQPLCDRCNSRKRDKLIAEKPMIQERPESRYNQIKEVMGQQVAKGQKINLRAISQETGAGYSTVKLYAPDIKKELGIEWKA